MFLQWLWLFGLFIFNLATITPVTYFAAARAETHTLFGIRFVSQWTFWGALVTMAIPVYIVTNYLFFYSYWYGYRNVFSGKMWLVILTNWIGNTLVT